MGATRYYLLTNVQGTAHPEHGSIDQANKELSDNFGLPTQVWWRDDIERRLDNHTDIKWSFPQIIRATDLLPLLVDNLRVPDSGTVPQTLRSYLAAQYNTDREIKFKQADLQRKLTELFVDLPLGFKRSHSRSEPRAKYRPQDFTGQVDHESYVSQLQYEDERRNGDKHPFEHKGLAAAFFLCMPYGNGVSRFVVEGAPGTREIYSHSVHIPSAQNQAPTERCRSKEHCRGQSPSPTSNPFQSRSTGLRYVVIRASPILYKRQRPSSIVGTAVS